MDINNLWMDIKNYMKNLTSITLAGDIILKNVNPLATISSDLELCKKVTQIIKEFSKVHPNLEFTVTIELHEIAIKMYTYNKKISDERFLDNMKNTMEQLLKVFKTLGELTIRLNMIGQIKRLGKVKKFQFINSDMEVLYRITEETQENIIKKLFRIKD